MIIRNQTNIPTFVYIESFAHSKKKYYLCKVKKMKMERRTVNCNEYGSSIQVASFIGEDANEMHAIIHVTPQMDGFESQLSRILDTYSLLLSMYPTYTCIFKRYFLSDATNQAMFLPTESNIAVSSIQQPPLDGSKVSLWCYMVSGVKAKADKNTAVFEHNGYAHHFQTNLFNPSGDSYRQTQHILEQLVQYLKETDMTLTANCLRTWFFIRDVDTHYAGMVKARRELFEQQGLTDKTHYIASTGIGGNPAHPSALVQLESYAVKGLGPHQFHHLYAPTHLNPTYEYGVTFERATKVKYGDRSHILVSGTASIDNKGNVLHLGDVVKQCHRMWENVEMLLKEGGSSLNDVAQIIVYLRDSADYAIVNQLFQEKFPDFPVVITLAPVCRPTWLIEMECIAISSKGDKLFPNF